MVIATALLTAACKNSAMKSAKIDGSLSDSVTLQIEKIAETDTAQAFLMLDSLHQSGALAEHTYYYTRARIYQGTRDRLLAINYVRRAYETPYVSQHDSIRAQVLQWMTRIMLPLGDHQSCIRQAVEGIRLARKLNDPFMEADFLMLIGMCRYDMGDKQNAWKEMNRGMEKVKTLSKKELKTSERTKLAVMALTTATAFANDQDMDQTIASCRTTLAVLDTLHGYNADMLGGQAYAMMAGAFAKLAENDATLRDSADHYARLYWLTNYGKQNKGQRLKTYFKFSGKYEQGLQVTEDYLARYRQQADTVNRQYAELLHESEDYNVALGRYRQAYNISRRATILADTLHARDMHQKAMEYAEKFESKEKDIEIARQRQLVILLSVIVASALAVLAILIFFMLHIKRKNRDLENVICSLEEKQRLLGRIIPSSSALSHNDENENLQKFLEMERIIDEQKTYLDPTANIDMVMERAGYSRRTSTKLIQQFASTNKRLDYLNKKRVEYAAYLLVAEPSLSSKEVGARSGFYEDSTFRRNFKKYYGVTPTAYRALHAG